MLGSCLNSCALPVSAHEIRPAIATAKFGQDGRFEIKIKVNAEVSLVGIGPDHSDTENSPEAQLYDDLRAFPPADLEKKFRAFGPRWLASKFPSTMPGPNFNWIGSRFRRWGTCYYHGRRRSMSRGERQVALQISAGGTILLSAPACCGSSKLAPKRWSCFGSRTVSKATPFPSRCS